MNMTLGGSTHEATPESDNSQHQASDQRRSGRVMLRVRPAQRRRRNGWLLLHQALLPN